MIDGNAPTQKFEKRRSLREDSHLTNATRNAGDEISVLTRDLSQRGAK